VFEFQFIAVTFLSPQKLFFENLRRLQI